MSRGNKWVPMDQYLAQDLKLITGSFSRIEAMYAYTLDQDKGIKGTIAGYAVQWSWSRNKVRHFVNSIRTDKGHIRDRKRTHEGHPIHFIDKALMGKKDRSRTDKGQVEDRLHDTTIQPNPNPKPKKEKDIPKNIKKEDPQFDKFWEMYDKKTDKKKCLSKFKKLKQDDIDSIFTNLPAYVSATPDPTYRKNPITYLNNESWNDQIIPKGKLNGKAKNYTGPDTREPVIPDRMPEY